MFSVGELVRWYETYAYDDIVKDSGIGILLEFSDYSQYRGFKVYRIKKQDIVYLYDGDVEKLKNDKDV